VSASEDKGRNAEPKPFDFIRAKVAEDLRTDKYGGRVATRFPPEPNGFLHIGHAKAICLNFGIALENEGGTCNLRFDDTNPVTEEEKYARAIQHDIRWLGFDWEDRLYYASDYFDKFYAYAVKLVEDGKAYVDSLNEQQIREYRGTVTERGREGPYRSRSVEENLDLLERMRAGEFEDGAHVLRAKIDMASPNMLMRDPLLYRIRHAHHYRAGDRWCIYPMYDFAHCLEDAIEHITHSLCSLEFKDNRELYDWVLREVGIPNPPEQTEFARLDLDYTVLSKRKLIRLVAEGYVAGWDDPRMPTLAGLRRRGVTPEAIRTFCDMIGVARVDSRVDVGKLEFCIRDDLNQRVPRVMCVLRPLRVVITNYPEERVEWLDAPYYPHDVPKEGSRKVPFSRVLYIEREDFEERPHHKFFRLAPGREVRLRYGYFIRCDEVVKDPVSGEVTELLCSYDPATKGGGAPDGRKVKGTIHWVSAEHSLPAEIRLYDRLFTVPDPDDPKHGEDFTSNLNPHSLITLCDSRVEPSVANDPAGTRYQFERQGYFCSDVVESSSDHLVFNRTISLRDTWAKIAAEEAEKSSSARSDKQEAKRDAGTSPARTPKPKRARVGTPEHAKRKARYRQLGLGAGEARVLADNRALAEFFDAVLAVYDNPKAVAGWVINDVMREVKDRDLADLPFSAEELGALARLVHDGVVSRTIAKEVFAVMARDGGDPQAIVRERGLEQVSDAAAIQSLVEKVIANHAAEVERYREGKTALLAFFVGQVMKESGGKASPTLVGEMIQEKLG
jgi:glutaminyl-tRNA synthetase